MAPRVPLSRNWYGFADLSCNELLQMAIVLVIGQFVKAYKQVSVTP
jgi:hypothetical protein